MAQNCVNNKNKWHNKWGNYYKELLILSLPIILGSLGHILIGAGNVIVAGRYSTLALAAISVATAIFMTFMIAGIGLLMSISPCIANFRGERKPCKNLFNVTLKYTFFVGLLVFALIWGVAALVPYIRLAENMAPLVIEYLQIASFSIFGVFVFTASKEFLQAYEIVVFPNIVAIGAVVLNVALSYVLVFGLGIIPSFGVKGVAISALVMRTLEGLILLYYCKNFLKGNCNAESVKIYINDLLKTGTPIAVALFSEFLGFNIIAVLVGKFSALFAAVHNVIVTMTGITYMIPLSIANAMAIKVGFANGEKNLKDIKKYSASGFVMIFVFMLVCAFIYALFPTQLMQIFTNDQEVVKTGVPVIFLVVCFVLFDGIQCAASGALKGLKKTGAIMFTMAFSYFVFGIPIGCILAYKYNIVLMGFWTGLAVALFVASIVATGFLVFNIKKSAREFLS